MNILPIISAISVSFFCCSAVAMNLNYFRSDPEYNRRELEYNIARCELSAALSSNTPLVSPFCTAFFSGDFALWCNALACKKMETEGVGTMPVHIFLNTEDYMGSYIECESRFDHNKRMPGGRTHTNDAGLCDRRFARRWRRLQEVSHAECWNNKDDIGDRWHVDPHLDPPSDAESDDEAPARKTMHRNDLFNNSLPIGAGVLNAAVHADRSEKVWIELQPLKAMSDSGEYPLYVLWVEPLEKPQPLLKKNIRGDWMVHYQNTAVMMSPDDTSFQVYRPLSEPQKHFSTVEAWDSGPYVSWELRVPLEPEPWVAVVDTYTLACVTDALKIIPFPLLAHWYAAFKDFRAGILTPTVLTKTTNQIRMMVNRYEMRK
jgi:hypothetical protein